MYYHGSEIDNFTQLYITLLLLIIAYGSTIHRAITCHTWLLIRFHANTERYEIYNFFFFLNRISLKKINQIYYYIFTKADRHNSGKNTFEKLFLKTPC